MILLTPELHQQLLTNGRDRDANHVPVVKLFNPLGEGVWLATELDEDGDTLFGLADLGEPELGSFSLAEMIAVRLPLGLGIERDILFEGLFPISKLPAEPAASVRPSACFTRSTEPHAPDDPEIRKSVKAGLRFCVSRGRAWNTGK